MKEQVKDFLVITGGTAIVAAAVFFFLVPSHVFRGQHLRSGSGAGKFHSLADLNDHYDLECGTADRGIFVYRQGIWWKNGVYVVLIAGDNRNSGEIIS